jgi:hypothetical protein
MNVWTKKFNPEVRIVAQKISLLKKKYAFTQFLVVCNTLPPPQLCIVFADSQKIFLLPRLTVCSMFLFM